MPTSVEFNDYSRTRDIEIDDKITDVLLSVNGNGQSLQKIIPKVFFFIGHSFSKRLCRTDELFIVVIYQGRDIGSCFDAEKRQKSKMLSV